MTARSQNARSRRGRAPTEKSAIVFAGALYDAPLWTNRQQIATRLAERGWKVLYVEPRLLLFRQLFGHFRGVKGWRRWLLRQIAPWHAQPNLWVQSQANILPGSRRFPFVGWVNHVLWNGWHVRLHAWEVGIRNPVLLIYDTEAAEFLGDFPKARVVYDCVDDHRAQAGVDRNPRLVEREEAAIAKRAAAIAVTTEPLRARFTSLNPNVHLVPNAADVQAFLTKPSGEPADITHIPHPRIGTVGALDTYKVDVQLLHTVAQAHPEWHFVLVGPVDYSETSEGNGVAGLRALPNIHFLGWKPKEEIPGYVHAFDVAIIPYRESPYNRASFPLKFWEFMATGKPVVASGLPSLESYRRLVTLVSSPDTFIRGIRDALARGAEEGEARRAEARQHDWAARIGRLEQLLASVGSLAHPHGRP